ncbi:fimbrial biogenesis chaperone [Orbus wheelerorum]|uniref:fimbrial biogenesis chaperone n=1 Tax=Orbus wheelerorum TaxID=3074111 RepID=UPI00370D9E4B
MKAYTLIFALFFSFCSFANNIIINGTRFIFSSDDKEITINMTNLADRPAIAQAWLDNGDPKEAPGTIIVPFQISPPVARVEAKAGQALRIKLIDKDSLPTDRESLWWLNILDIPPMNKVEDEKDKNTLQLAIRSRFKFIYRPINLGKPELAVGQLIFKTNGKKLTINNPTPFFITITKIAENHNYLYLNSSAIMLAPKSTKTIQLDKILKHGETLIIDNINDYGSIKVNKIIVK